MTTLGAGESTARLPGTVLFGAGTVAEVPDLVVQAGSRRPLVVTDPGVAATGLADRLVSELRKAGLVAEAWSRAGEHVADPR